MPPQTGAAVAEPPSPKLNERKSPCTAARGEKRNVTVSSGAGTAGTKLTVRPPAGGPTATDTVLVADAPQLLVAVTETVLVPLAV